jgi:hypothetical protein
MAETSRSVNVLLRRCLSEHHSKETDLSNPRLQQVGTVQPMFKPVLAEKHTK